MTTRTPAEVFHPGEFLKEELEERGWTQADLADILGRPVSLVNEIIVGKRGISAETAKGLAAAFDTSPELWLRLDAAYQLWKARGNGEQAVKRRARIYSVAPVKDMLRRGWIETSDNVDVLEQRVLDFFRMESIADEPQFQSYAARKATPYTGTTPAQMAWLLRARQLAQAVKAERYSEVKLEQALEQLRYLLANPQEIRHLPAILAGAGIRFLVVEPLPGTRIDGACFWLDPESPVVVLSVRFDRIDNFWYTLMHEVAHVKSKDALSLDTNVDSGYDSECPNFEQAADTFAWEFLVPLRKIEGFIAEISPRYSALRIATFAATLGVHPGLIVGQLHHRGEIAWSNFRRMLTPVREIITAAAVTDGWGAYTSAAF